jgi:NOL1/NOP2/fmu family ribosome biogenesis protein
MFRDAVAVNEWSEENTAHCSARQKRILSDVWPSLKGNGILIYSTCTFNPGENEENIKWLTAKHKAATVEINISDFNRITEIDYLGIKGYGFYPGRIKGEGLFISVSRKTGSPGKFIARIQKKQGIEPKKADLEIVKKWTLFKAENIVRSDEKLFSYPGLREDFCVLDKSLRIIRAGTRIGIEKKNGYVPDHELALSESLRRDVFPVAELDYNEALRYLRRDNFLPSVIPKGWFIVTFKGVNLGFCNNIGYRVNNYYPVDWRIRMSVTEASASNIILWKS